jgi:hypothetical protein
MRTKTRLLIGMLVSALIVAGVYSATSASASGDRTKTLLLEERDSRETEVDVGEPGFGAGDKFVFRSKLFKNETRVGTVGGECTIVAILNETNADVQCVATLRLKHGHITGQALITFTEEPEPFTVAITGGTGRYRNAHGEIVITENPDAGTAEYKIRLA